jgi:hypothetical protein
MFLSWRSVPGIQPEPHCPTFLVHLFPSDPATTSTSTTTTSASEVREDKKVLVRGRAREDIEQI